MHNKRCKGKLKPLNSFSFFFKCDLNKTTKASWKQHLNTQVLPNFLFLVICPKGCRLTTWEFKHTLYLGMAIHSYKRNPMYLKSTEQAICQVILLSVSYSFPSLFQFHCAKEPPFLVTKYQKFVIIWLFIFSIQQAHVYACWKLHTQLCFLNSLLCHAHFIKEFWQDNTHKPATILNISAFCFSRFLFFLTISVIYGLLQPHC